MTRGRRLIVPGLVALGYLLAFVQRPGKAIYDSRIELSADPSLFLHRVTSVWSPTVDLGHVQSGQFVGYLFPMAPWFAAGHAAGVPVWIVERLWMGTLLAAGRVGHRAPARRRLRPPRAGSRTSSPACCSSPTRTSSVYATRGTVTLLAYAALPWLLLAANRGMRRAAALALARGARRSRSRPPAAG